MEHEFKVVQNTDTKKVFYYWVVERLITGNKLYEVGYGPNCRPKHCAGKVLVDELAVDTNLFNLGTINALVAEIEFAKKAGFEKTIPKIHPVAQANYLKQLKMGSDYILRDLKPSELIKLRGLQKIEPLKIVPKQTG